MNKETTVFIQHILESIENIETFSKNLSREEFTKNRLKQSAIIRELEIIGEAVKNIPLSFRKQHDKIKWSKLTGTRDKLIHHYFGIDLNLTFKIITSDLPQLKEEIKRILEDINLKKESSEDK